MDDFIYAMAASGLLQDLARECEPTELQDLIDIGYNEYRLRQIEVQFKSKTITKQYGKGKERKGEKKSTIVLQKK